MAFVRQSSLRASRLAYEIFVGPIPDGQNMLHDPIRCNNPACINPKHLQPGTQLENAIDRSIADTQPHGSRHYRTKLNEEMVADILKQYHEQRQSQKAIAAQYDISFVTVHDIVYRKTWAHVLPSLYPPPKTDGRKSMTDAFVRQIRHEHASGDIYKVIAKRHNISIGQVHYACKCFVLKS